MTILRFGKELLTRLTDCSLCFMSFKLFPVLVLRARFLIVIAYGLHLNMILLKIFKISNILKRCNVLCLINWKFRFSN